MKTFLRITALYAAMTLVAACGGGSGSGGDGGPVGDNGGPLQAVITPDNAEEIASDVVSGMLDSRELGEFGGIGLIGDSGNGATLAKAAAATSNAWTKSMPRLFAAPIGPDVSQCDIDGTLTVTGELASLETLTAGDNVRLSFADCDDGDGEVLDGDLVIAIDTFSGDLLTGFFTLGVGLDFEVFRVTEGSTTTTVNGDASVLVDTADYPMSTFAIAGASLSVTEGNGTITLDGFSVDVTVDESSQPAAYTYEASGNVDVPFHGVVTYRVLTPFTGFGDDNPDTGVLYVEGDAGGNITITALSSQEAQLEIDYNGDGLVDETLIVTWIELDA